MTMGLPTQQFDARRWQSKVPGDQPDDGLVGLAVGRWCGRAYSQEAVDDADDCIMFGARYHANRDDEIIALCPGTVAKQFF